MALGEVVENPDLMAGVQKFFDANASDVSGTAGH
jgi:hypothetical protein